VYKGNVCPKGVAALSNTANPPSSPLAHHDDSLDGGEIKGKSTAADAAAVSTVFTTPPPTPFPPLHVRLLIPPAAALLGRWWRKAVCELCVATGALVHTSASPAPKGANDARRRWRPGTTSHPRWTNTHTHTHARTSAREFRFANVFSAIRTTAVDAGTEADCSQRCFAKSTNELGKDYITSSIFISAWTHVRIIFINVCRLKKWCLTIYTRNTIKVSLL